MATKTAHHGASGFAGFCNCGHSLGQHEENRLRPCRMDCPYREFSTHPKTVTKWTSGPWRVYTSPLRGEFWVGTVNGGKIIADAPFGGKPDNWEANARLISLAPEMAELLQAFVHAHLDWSAPSRDARLIEMDRIAHEAESILAKLEGK